MGEGMCARGGVFGGARHLLGSLSGRVCGTLLEKQKRRREYRIEVRARRGDKDEPVAENRAPNDNRKGSKLNFDQKKIECARNGLATKQNKKMIRNEGIGTEKRANVRQG
jgi:hypothetical protein